MTEYVTTADAARELGITRRRVTQLIAAGRLQADWLGRVLAVRRSDLEAFRRLHRPPGGYHRRATVAS